MREFALDDGFRMHDESLINVIVYGQSNAHVGGLKRVPEGQRTVRAQFGPTDRTLMLNTGLLGVDGRDLQPETLTDFVAAQEDAVRGESGGISFMRYATGAEDAAGLAANKYLYRTFGKSGAAISELVKGGKIYSDILVTLRATRDIARRKAQRIFVPAVIFRQGEADAGGTDTGIYRAALEGLAEDLAHDIQEITEQEISPWLLLCILSAPNHPKRKTSMITRAQVDALGADGVRILPSICPYWMNGAFGFISGQAVHWKPLAKAFIVEYEARALRILMEAMLGSADIRLGATISRRVFDGDTWSTRAVPFETSPRTNPRSVSRQGSTLRGDVYYAEGGLHVFEGFRPAAANHGFHWSGSEAIKFVTTENTAQQSSWIVELDGWTGRGGCLSYATNRSPGVPVDDGPSCYGDIFDDCKEVSLATGYNLRSGMLPFWVHIDP
jgi:hypothetical protein